MRKIKHHQLRGLLLLGLIWLVGVVSDRIWFAFDNSTPAWDQADYLTGALNYWQALKQPQWFSGEWWTSFWQLSSKIPPLTYILAAVAQHIFGRGIEQATLVNSLFSAILLASVYELGVLLFDIEVGLWAAALCQVFPSLYRYRLDFLLDYPLTAAVTLSFFCLTLWRVSAVQSGLKAWLRAAAFGISFGLTLLVKQTALLFLFTPILWLVIRTLRHRQWQQFGQLVGGLLLSIFVFAPWYRINWLTVITSGKRATIDSAIAEGDPPLNTLAAWTYYWEILPFQVSWLLLIIPIVGVILYWRRRQHPRSSLMWLGVFLIGAYFFGSLNINKDERYILPYLPVVALFLAYGLTRWRGRWGSYARWGSVSLAVLLMFFNIFPVGSWGTSIARISPKAEHYAVLDTSLPHAELIETAIQNAPYLRSTLGVLPSTAAINQHNVNYYGALRDFQVYGRQVGSQSQQVAQDMRSLDWFVTKTGDQGSVPEAQAAIMQTVTQSPDFQIVKSWLLPDNSTLNLYHRKLASVEVKPITSVLNRVTLSRVTIPPQAPPGKPIPVTYEWVGSGEQLESGLVLLDWRDHNSTAWIHDHAIALGNLVASPDDTLQVVERMAMLPPATTPAGSYTLSATYLNRHTGETYPMTIPPVTLQIEPNALATPAPELDLLTQLRTLAATLPTGTTALERIFAEVARINQYDPTQDYLSQTQQTLNYRWQQQPQLDWAYTLALSTVLQRQADAAIAALEKVTQLDAQNPYAHAYLAFVHLYNWQGFAAESSLKTARSLNANIPEIQTLSGVAALMRGDLINAWHYLMRFQNTER